MPKSILSFNSVSKIFPAISTKESTKREELIAIENITFEVYEKEILVILGPSGCGKTTLLRISAGLDMPSTGQVFFNSVSIKGPSRERGMIFQHYSSFPWLTVLDNIIFGLKYRHNIKREEWDEIAHHLIKLVALDGFENSYPDQLSGGMQQRLAIARTFAADPTILLMDEPFGALDTQNREFLQLQLLEAQEDAKKTILFVTHDVEEAIFLATRLIILTARPGKIKKEFLISLPKPHTLEMKTTNEFLELKRDILNYTREEAIKTDQLWRQKPTEKLKAFRDERKFSLRRHKL